MRIISATRYVTPLREGGSLPAVVEGDDLGLYVLKFRGAGQGPEALIAELVAGGLPVRRARFHRLTAKRSSIIQTSPVHAGRCTNAATIVEHLMQRMVRL